MQRIFYCILIWLLCFCEANSDSSQYKPRVCEIPKQNYGILTKKNTQCADTSLANCNCDFGNWRCFPVENVSLILMDAGYDDMDHIKPMEHAGDIKIIAHANYDEKKHDYQIRYEYNLRRMWFVSGAEDIFHKWQKLMKHEKYVCLEGVFDEREKYDTYKNQEVYGAIFDKIRTKHGCDSWFIGGCRS